MADIALIEVNEAVAEMLSAGQDGFEARYAVRVSENADLIRDVVQQAMALLAAIPRESPWGGYLAVDKTRATVVGTCAFKTGPTDDGSIEIAYFTFPQFEGHGFATAMAKALIDIAVASSVIQRVVAHTLPQQNASTRVLEKAGMHCLGEVEDPQDGRVWRWQYDVKT